MAQVPHGRHGVVLVECYKEAAKPEGLISGLPNEFVTKIHTCQVSSSIWKLEGKLVILACDKCELVVTSSITNS